MFKTYFKISVFVYFIPSKDQNTNLEEILELKKKKKEVKWSGKLWGSLISSFL